MKLYMLVADQLIVNPDFRQGHFGWGIVTDQKSGLKTYVNSSSEGEVNNYVCELTQPSFKRTAILQQKGIFLSKGTYKVTLEAKSTVDFGLEVLLQLPHAPWTKKNGETFYGYKNHAKVDTKSKFINTYTVTDASVHDSQALDVLLTEKDKDQDLHADSAYTGEEQDKIIEKYEMKNKVHEKGYRNRPLTEEQKASNTKKSKIRARVEHVFGFMEQSMKGLIVRSVGITRASGIIGLINLTYNLFRYEQVMRLNILTTK